MTLPANKAIPSIRAVLFDLDDTLYDREAVFLRWANHFVQERLGLETGEERQAAFARIAALDPDGYGSKHAVFAQLTKLFPELPDERTVLAVRAYDEFLMGIALETETDVLLSALEQAAVPFGIVTNGTARQWQKIEQLGLRTRTSCLFVSSGFGSLKPAPAIFLAAAKNLGVPPREILFVGDNPVNDIFGAQRAGMKTAWLHRNKPWPETLADLTPDYTINGLGEVIRCLALTPGPSPSVAHPSLGRGEPANFRCLLPPPE